MKVLLINSVCGIGSTGKICGQLAKEFEAKGDQIRIAYGRNDTVPDEYKKYGIKIGNKLDLFTHAIISRLDDAQGLGSKRATRRFLEWADRYDPDLLWLHNIHGYYINYPILFDWIKKRPRMQVMWTLHDCWAFTGHCAYFTMAKCNNWKTHCRNCSQYKNYPKSVVDRSYRNFEIKKESFLGCRNLKLITPSRWLKDLTAESYLKNYPIEVKYNEIDYGVFRPIESDFRKKHSLEHQKIILGVANVWDARKGLSDFVRLSYKLPKNFTIVLVGLSKKQIRLLPPNILGIEKTDSVDELVKLYSTADVFVNTTYEDNYPTVNLEAQACGTPVITYRTGGSPESVPESNVIMPGDLESLLALLKNIDQLPIKVSV